MKTLSSISLKSEYVTMADGTLLAVSLWLQEDDALHDKSFPAVLVTTRYWRAMTLMDDALDGQSYTAWAKILIEQGYRLVVADARGTGASFGSRKAEVDRNEVNDIGELINWIADQPWCDGRVATHGTSYSGITTLYSLATASKALKLGICRAPDFDMYRHLIAPGGIVNHWFVKHWGNYTAAQDANSVKGMFSCGYVPTPEQAVLDNMQGVLPVDNDTDGLLLKSAVNEHADNFNLAQHSDQLDYIDGFISENNPGIYATDYRDTIDQSGTSLVIRCGWHDAATALGALSLFATFKQLPVQVILGPFNHEGTYIVDPFKAGDGTNPDKTPLDEGRAWRIDFLNQVFNVSKNENDKASSKSIERCVRYYTLGENRWKKTQQWPLPNTTMRRFYFHGDHQLTLTKPTAQNGEDQYQVDPITTTGRYNRWHAQSEDQPVHFPDRQFEDKKLKVYDSAPLTKDTEITGHPVVTLFVRSSSPDGQFFVYLETIDPDGRVRLLTEGQLRGIHRKVSDKKAPYIMFGPYHSLQKKDAEPMAAGKINELRFDLLPISVMLKKGHRLRVAIAGSDCDTFAPIQPISSPELLIQRNKIHASFIDIPVV